MRVTSKPTPNAVEPARMKAAVAISILYALSCIGALLLALPWIQDLVGMERDPLGGIFAVVLALPWIFLLDEIGGAGVVAGVVAIIFSMLANLAIILGIGCLLQRRRAS